jgi:ribose 5-phosphate isomerase A
MNVSNLDDLKRRAARKATDYVRDGMVVGLGTGSTAKHAILALGERIKKGLKIKGVPTSQEAAKLARKAKIPLLPDDEVWPIDVAIDGADQVDEQLNLIKGGGGALLKEKIVAAAARQFIVVVDHTKRVPVLGGSFPLPVEVVPFGWRNTARKIETFGGTAVLRKRGGKIFKTEDGHYILDVQIARIDNPAALESKLNQIPGVIENGLFVGRTDILIVGSPQGVDVRLTSKQ